MKTDAFKCLKTCFRYPRANYLLSSPDVFYTAVSLLLLKLISNCKCLHSGDSSADSMQRPMRGCVPYVYLFMSTVIHPNYTVLHPRLVRVISLLISCHKLSSPCIKLLSSSRSLSPGKTEAAMQSIQNALYFNLNTWQEYCWHGSFIDLLIP